VSPVTRVEVALGPGLYAKAATAARRCGLDVGRWIEEVVEVHLTAPCAHAPAGEPRAPAPPPAADQD
jgi:hypothetical protein